MDIKEIRNKTGLSRTAFSKTYGIPLRTLENWEAGKRTPPEYVLALLENAVRGNGRQELEEVRRTDLGEGFVITEYRSSEYEVTVTENCGTVSIKADPRHPYLPEIRLSNGEVTRIGFAGDVILEKDIEACADGLKAARVFI